MSYKFREDIAMADVAFEAEGKTLEELFEAAALAVTNTMVKELKSVKTTEKKEMSLENKELDRLLHDFMQEIIFEKDANLLLFSGYELKITKLETGNWKLTATCKGEKLDMNKHELLVDVKAVSWHMFKVEQDQKTKMWGAFVILDV